MCTQISTQELICHSRGSLLQRRVHLSAKSTRSDLPYLGISTAKDISSVMSLPDSNGSVSLTFPRNMKTAIFSILASGNGAEEFWYTNVPSEYVNTFQSRLAIRLQSLPRSSASNRRQYRRCILALSTYLHRRRRSRPLETNRRNRRL